MSNIAYEPEFQQAYHGMFILIIDPERGLFFFHINFCTDFHPLQSLSLPSPAPSSSRSPLSSRPLSPSSPSPSV